MSAPSENPVLIGYDGSDNAATAIRQAGALLAPRRAVVACIWTSFAALALRSDIEQLTGSVREAAEELDAGERQRADATAAAGAALAREVGFEAEHVSARGKAKAWPTLLRLADERELAAIVVGCRGLSAMKSALIGSVASGVLHHSHLPVLLVPTGTSDAPGDGPLVIAYDGSDPARRAIAAAGSLMPGRKAAVESIWTSCAAVAASGAIGMPAGVGAAGAESLDRELRARTEETAAEGAALARDAGLDAEGEAVTANGNVCHTLLDAARRRRAEAVVAGSRGHSAISDILLGGVSSGLVHHSPVPVLIAPDR